MMLKQNDLVCISTHDGFTHRLMSTTFRITDSGKVLCDTSFYPNGKFTGTLLLPEQFAESWLELICRSDLATLLDEYDGQWDDMGIVVIDLSLDNTTKRIRIYEIFDRSILKTAVEKQLFSLLKEIYNLQEHLYCYLCNTENAHNPTVSYEELTKTQTQWNLEKIQNTPIESFSKKRRKQLTT